MDSNQHQLALGLVAGAVLGGAGLHLFNRLASSSSASPSLSTSFKTLDELVGNTPLVRLQRLPSKLKAGNTNTILVKLEGLNPSGSIMARPAFHLVKEAETKGLKKGDTLIAATSGNMGVALAAAGAVRGYRVTLVLPSPVASEFKHLIAAYGAVVVETPSEGGLEGARDKARSLESEGKGLLLDQFTAPSNPEAHYQSTGPEIWHQTQGGVTHVVGALGSSATLMGVGRYLKEKKEEVQICGVSATVGSAIPGMPTWSEQGRPPFFNSDLLDRRLYVSQADAEATCRALAEEEGILVGPSSGGAIYQALELSRVLDDALILVLACDSGERYLSQPVYKRD